MFDLVTAIWLNVLTLEYELILPNYGKFNYTVKNDWHYLEFFNDEVLLDCQWPTSDTRNVYFPELKKLPDDIDRSATGSYKKDVFTEFASSFTKGSGSDIFDWFMLKGHCSTAKSLPDPPRYELHHSFV